MQYFIVFLTSKSRFCQYKSPHNYDCYNYFIHWLFRFFLVKKTHVKCSFLCNSVTYNKEVSAKVMVTRKSWKKKYKQLTEWERKMCRMRRSKGTNKNWNLKLLLMISVFNVLSSWYNIALGPPTHHFLEYTQNQLLDPKNSTQKSTCS
jgi:hypothetical protein